MSLRFLFVTLAGLLLQTAPNVDTARVEGTVINQITKEPVDRVQVKLEPERGASQTVATDAEGKFAIRGLAAGRYQIKLTRSGFAEPELNGGTRHLSLQPDQELKGVHIEMVATSAISGRVVDRNRQPVESVMVQAFKVQYLNGRRVLAPWDAMKAQYLPLMDFGPAGSPVEIPPQAKTNAEGEYRLFGLPPGEYYLSIWSNGPTPGIDEPPVYYPGVSDPSIAIPVVVHGGSPEATGMDIQIPEIRGYSAQFLVVPPAGVGYDCTLMPALQLKAFTLVQHSTNLDVVHFSGFDYQVGNDRTTHMRIAKTADNTWTTGKLPPGSYEMFLSSCANSFAGLVGQMTFTLVDRDIDAGTVVVPPTVRIPGRVRNPTGNDVRFGSLLIRLRAADWRAFFPGSAPNKTPDQHNRVKPDGTFAFEWDWDASNGLVFGRVAPGQFMVDLAGLPPDVYVSSIKYGAKEVRDSGMIVDSGPPGEIEITLGSPGATVSGTVRNSKDARASDSAVVLVPQSSVDAPVSFSRATMTDQDGTFSVRGIPPGTYWVLAPEGIDLSAFDNPEFFKQYQSRATKVVLENGATAAVNLRVTAR